uniref:thiol-disulfide oxidoreductase DCC family protein n=1 Tax=uncultured Draconibacterium sp. TaxID=1573823 RepID=UPI0032163809
MNSKSIILFDGVCNLCNGSVNFILKRDKKEQFSYLALQSDEGKRLIKEFRAPAKVDSVILIHRNTIYIESDAALKISELLPSPWKWLTVFKVIPKKWRNKIYRCIAKNRYRWFGKQENCRIV